MKYPCFLGGVCFVFGFSVEHTHVVCVVRKEAEANETPGATNMEVQRNVGFSSSSSGNDTLNFASSKPDGERSTTRNGKHTHTHFHKNAGSPAAAQDLCARLLWHLNGGLIHFRQFVVEAFKKKSHLSIKSVVNFHHLICISSSFCFCQTCNLYIQWGDVLNTPLCHYWENFSFYQSHRCEWTNEKIISS